MLLSDNGADVIKVEPPGGDPFRSLPDTHAWLRGRRSTELDLADDADRATFPGPGPHRPTWSWRASPRARPTGSGIDADDPARPRTRASSTARSPATAHHPAPPRPVPPMTPWSRPDSGSCTNSAATWAVRSATSTARSPYLPDLADPRGDGARLTASGPIFTYTPWPSICAAYLATIGINAALLARLRTGRRPARGDLTAPGGALALTASKWQRAERNDEPGLPRPGSTTSGRRRGSSKCADERWIEQWVPNPRFVLSSADGDTLELRSDAARHVARRPERHPDRCPRTSSCWPTTTRRWSRPFARFPSDDWVRVGRGGRRAPPAGAHSRRGLWPTRRSSPSRPWSTSSTPSTACIRQVGILYGLSAHAGPGPGPGPPRRGAHRGSCGPRPAAVGPDRAHGRARRPGHGARPRWTA